MDCLVCGKEFGGVRRTAKYCSDKCRKLAFRETLSVPRGEVSVPNNAVKDRVSVPKEEYPLSVPKTVTGDDPTDKKALIDDVSGKKVDIEKDLKLSLHKDFGVSSWTPNGIFIRGDITVQQVRNIYRVVAAKNGWAPRVFA